MTYSGQSNLKQVWLVTEGNRPNLIFADYENLEAAADMAAFGIFFYQGQVCSANSRLYVERSIHDDFVKLMVARAKASQPGDPLNFASKMGATGSASMAKTASSSRRFSTMCRMTIRWRATRFSAPSCR